MDIIDFSLLEDKEKEKIISADGIYLTNYHDKDDMCDIYELHDFYVAFCYKLNYNLKASISAHSNADELPHLNKIKNIFA